MRRSLAKSLLAALLLAGCSTSTQQAPSEPSQQVAVPAPEPTPMPTFFVYVVKFRGEMLGRIAEWYTGSYDNWRKIARVNSDLPVPNARLKIGREVKIPTEIVVRQDPLPQPKPKRTTPKTAREEAKPSAGLEGSAAPHEAPESAEAPALPAVIGPR